MNDVMICLVGEQPMPNLLPIRYYSPEQVLLVYTEGTEEVKKRLETVLRRGPEVYTLEVSPFDILDIRRTLDQFITGRGWHLSQIVFNLTGGTKAMAFAAYSLAQAWRSRFIYLESEEAESRVYRYSFNQDGIALLDRDEVIPGVISLDDYLKAHLGMYLVRSFSRTEGGKFEKAVYQVLEPVVDEIKPGIQHLGQIDIDLAFCYGNQVGIAEVKTGGAARSSEGIKQLNAASEFLDIYIKKLLIVDTMWDITLDPLRGWAEASEIKVIELPSYGQTGSLSDQDCERLRREVAEALRCWVSS
jgi:hypothetical protein